MKRGPGGSSVTSTKAIAQTRTKFSSIIRSRTSQAEPCYVRVAVTLEKGSYLHALDIAQEARGVIVHFWNRTCRCKCGVGSLRPDQPTVAGSLGMCENHCLKSNLCQWTSAVNGLDYGFRYGASA